MVERRAICVIFPAGRCYVALEELRWGAFGDVIRQSETGQVNQLLDILRHKALTQMAQESGGSATVRLNTLDWLGGQGGSRQITSGMTRLTGWETGAVKSSIR